VSRAQFLPADLPAPAAVGAADIDRHGRARIIVIGLVFSCLALQRFGLPFGGGKSVDAVGPIGLALMAWGILRGAISMDRQRMAMMTLLTLLAVAGLYVHVTSPDRFGAAPEMSSLLQFLAMTGFAVFSFAEPMPEETFFRLINRGLVLVAIAGLAQFALQTVGLRLFSFQGLAPDRLLFESGYNVVIPLGFGNLFKSNGFFLLEPSIFSQFMAMGLIIEVLTARRIWACLLLVLALLSSASGTGWIVLASFLLSACFSMGLRGIALAAIVALGLAAILGGVAFLQPDFAATLTDRMNEITRQGTSGHLRFITPFWLLGDVLARQPNALWVGIGAGVSERLTLPYEYTVNTPVKIVAEYGLPALLVYVALFLVGQKTHIQKALAAPALVLLLLTGGYQQFPPILFFISLLLCVARLTPASQPSPPG
jgi:hypothetical protein